MVQSTVEPGTTAQRKNDKWRLATLIVAAVALVAIGAALWLQGRVSEQQTRIAEQQKALDQQSAQLLEARRALEAREMLHGMPGRSSSGQNQPGIPQQSQMPMMPGMGGMMRHGMPGKQDQSTNQGMGDM